MKSSASFRVGVVVGLAALAAALQGQQPAQQQPQGQQTKVQEPPVALFRVDLVPTGSVFSYGEPTLEGDTYVFRILPERTIQRLPKAKVKAITQRSTDFSKEVVYQVDLAPSGSLLAREEPVKKGKLYVLNTFKQGTLMSVPEADVRKITRLTGMEAWKAEELELGVVLLAGDTPPGFNTSGGSAGPGKAPPAGAAPGAAPRSGNWTYEGKPGATDAYAPGNATVSKPGDTPMAPEPKKPPL